MLTKEPCPYPLHKKGRGMCYIWSMRSQKGSTNVLFIYFYGRLDINFKDRKFDTKVSHMRPWNLKRIRLMFSSYYQKTSTYLMWRDQPGPPSIWTILTKFMKRLKPLMHGRKHTATVEWCHYKGAFPFTCFVISEWHVEMLAKWGNHNIYIGCLIPSEAEQYGERIEKLGWKLRKSWVIKWPLYIESCYRESQPG